MAISVLQPMDVMALATDQVVSQFRFKPVRPPRRPPVASLVTWASYWMPAGLVPNTKPFWRSRKVSRMTWKLSVSVRLLSRRLSATMMADGSSS